MEAAQAAEQPVTASVRKMPQANSHPTAQPKNARPLDLANIKETSGPDPVQTPTETLSSFPRAQCPRVSPTLSRACSHGLNTGRDGTDVDNLEDGEVREYLGNRAEQEEDAVMLDDSAGGGTGAGDDNGNIIPDNEDTDNSLAQPNPEPQQGQNYAAIAAAAQGNGLHPQVYLFANAPVPAPVPAPIAPPKMLRSQHRR
ncbi:hypothetical protein B0H13DRAFT_1877755 [Mycena leptocephala]|nr:hypothetical protein B0H13DRAFT_1877755 [Mycena leptocephala]